MSVPTRVAAAVHWIYVVACALPTPLALLMSVVPVSIVALLLAPEAAEDFRT